MASSLWTPERVMELKRLWLSGLATADIATRLGTTRNAVIGKADRLKLPRRLSPLTPEGRAFYASLQMGADDLLDGANGGLIAVPLDPPTRIPVVSTRAAPIGYGARSAVTMIRSSSCKWPIGDPKRAAFHFCGRPVQDGVYCAEHAGLSYTRPVKASAKNRSKAPTKSHAVAR